MNKVLYLIGIYSSIVVLANSFDNSPDCTCYMNNNDFGNAIPIDSGNGIFSVSPKDYKIGDLNYGKLVAIGDLIFTQNNYPIAKSVNRMKLGDDLTCPEGFRIMTREDIQKITGTFKGDNFWMLSDSKRINIPLDYYFFTQTKTHFHDFSNNPSSYLFYGMIIRSNHTEVEEKALSTKTTSGVKVTKCVLDSSITSERVKMEEDLIQGVNHVKHIYKPNIIDYDVDLTGGLTIRGQSRFEFIPKNLGCYYIKIKWKMWNGTIITKCESYSVRPRLGSPVDTTLSIDHLMETVHAEKHIYRQKKIHFSHGNAPLAAKVEGGVYVFHAEKSDMSLKVADLDKDMQLVNHFQLYKAGYPMSIAALEDGFVVYYREYANQNKSVVTCYTKGGLFKWSTVIMNNGSKPTQVNEQVQFYDSDGSAVKGMELMYRPTSGKLVIGRKRIMLIFNHSNNFKSHEGGFLNYSGDSTISMDLNGKNVMLGDAWGASHSLSQKIVYDGLQFVTSSLGDGYPQQVLFTKNDGRHVTDYKDGKTNINNRFSYKTDPDIIHGSFPGNGKGRSCGRLGGLHVLGFQQFDKYAQVYSRRQCSSGIQNDLKTNSKNEIGIVFFDRELYRISTHIIGNGSRVNLIHSAMYGKNIFIIYTTTKRPMSEDYTFLPNDYDEEDDCYMLLVKPDGTIHTGPIKLNKSVITNDEPVTLHDGNVAWTYVDKNGNLKIYTLKSPKGDIEDDGSSGNRGQGYVERIGAIVLTLIILAVF